MTPIITIATARLAPLGASAERIARIAERAEATSSPIGYVDRAARNLRIDNARREDAARRAESQRREDAEREESINAGRLAEAARINAFAGEADRIADSLTGNASRNVRLATAVLLRGIAYERVMRSHGIKRDAAYQGVHRGVATLVELGSTALAEFVLSTRKRGPR